MRPGTPEFGVNHLHPQVQAGGLNRQGAETLTVGFTIAGLFAEPHFVNSAK